MISVTNYRNPRQFEKVIPLPKKQNINKIEKSICLKYKNSFITVCMITGAIIISPEFASASITAGLDTEIKSLYMEFIGIAKWIIIIKGGWDTVHKMLEENFEGAKKSFFQYLIVFGILLALPYGLGKIQSIFEGLEM